MKPRILVVEDDPSLGPALARALDAKGYDARLVESLDAARRIDLDSIDAAILDIGLPDGKGTSLLAEWRERRPELPLLFQTGEPTVATAVEAMRGGATDYLVKPVAFDALRAVLDRAIEASRLRREVVRLREALAPGAHGIVGTSPATRRLRERIGAVAAAPTTILVLGETGTGKELVARAIHAASGRSGRFVPINCAALPENLLESELFGHKRGAFTGAAADRKGLVAEAENGTLFLDEIGDMPVGLQAKVLRLLQDGEYRPVGENRERKARTRIVAATNRDPGREIAEGRFREDLYWRLAVVVIEIPPLRDRSEEGDELAAHFLARHAARLGKGVRSISPGALARLRAHDWPGNVRELESVIERAVLLARDDEITEAEIEFRRIAPAPPPSVPAPAGRLDETVRDATREELVRLLATHGTAAKAAAAAGRNRTSFYALLKRYGIRPR